MNAQPFLIGEGWMEVPDGNPTAEALFMRHYSRRPGGRKRRGLICGPGFKMVLLWPDARALFVWRRSLHRADDQVGVNCAVFRNEGAGLSSALIQLADAIAFARWPGERHFTFVDAAQTTRGRAASSPAGACFVHAGWRQCGVTEKGLVILERLP